MKELDDLVKKVGNDKVLHFWVEHGFVQLSHLLS